MKKWTPSPEKSHKKLARLPSLVMFHCLVTYQRSPKFNTNVSNSVQKVIFKTFCVDLVLCWIYFLGAQMILYTLEVRYVVGGLYV